MRILIAGQKWFGAGVFRALSALPGIEVCAVSAPLEGDRLAALAVAEGVRLIPAGTLCAGSCPSGVDLIVAAHSHDFISEATRNRARFGGIGYHPSLLPLHRGRDAIEWALRMRDRVTGGTVYRLSNRMDGGAVLAQKHVLVRPGDTAEDLWRRDLGPLGVRLLARVVGEFERRGFCPGREQDEALATWEPSIGRPPAYRPDLPQIPGVLDSDLEQDEVLQDLLENMKARAAWRATCPA
jgi:methionyl-tRNA formyltransferase